MVTVSEKSIEKAVEKIDNIPEEEIQEYIDNAAKEQPNIIAYALATGNDLKQENSEDLLYYTLVIWEAYKSETHDVPEVSEDILLKNEDAYLKNLEHLENSQNFENGVLDVINTTLQPALLSYIANELMDDSDTDDTINEEEVAEQGALFSALQIVIDSFNDVINGSPLKLV
ncbi:MAG: hypothetical protein HY958_09535 [Bacteroidia bacterium]|nr:hypothetical protein [Bacteroidia bacterium]